MPQEKDENGQPKCPEKNPEKMFIRGETKTYKVRSRPALCSTLSVSLLRCSALLYSNMICIICSTPCILICTLYTVFHPLDRPPSTSSRKNSATQNCLLRTSRKVGSRKFARRSKSRGAADHCWFAIWFDYWLLVDWLVWLVDQFINRVWSDGRIESSVALRSDHITKQIRRDLRWRKRKMKMEIKRRIDMG